MTEIVFKRSMSLGTICAENDDEFLKSCFLETPEYNELCDFKNRKMILLGRTGTGKTALLNEIKNKVDYYIPIKPDMFAMQYIASVPFVKRLVDEGINLDILYKFLWLHEIISQIIKNYFSYQKKKFLDELIKMVKDVGRLNQLKKYVDEYDGVFFDEGISEKITNELQSHVATVVGSDIAKLEGKLSDTQRQEIQIKASQYINKKQISQLKNIISIFKEYFSNNRQKKIVVVIDNLDDKWVESNSKYKLIDALLTAMKEFSDIINLKILIAMRADLLAKTCEVTKRQNEKDGSFTLKLDWNPQMLEELLNKRVAHLFAYKYKKQTNLTFKDIFKINVKGTTALNYIVDRSMMRPRDLISFVNLCLIEADGKTTITEENILSAELNYKKERLQALDHEWSNIYGNIEGYINILYHLGNKFKYMDLINNKYNEISEMIFEYFKDCDMQLKNDFKYSESQTSYAREQNIRKLLNVMYTIGLIGIKTKNSDIVKYATPFAASLTALDYNENIEFCIYPLFAK
ncbi:MAG: hypothetical protein IJ003_02240 [Candidatus Gastranaerophilales bacterium]|nr:hypothetical protein [Candidatus Gastranaerophilales bacterium]